MYIMEEHHMSEQRVKVWCNPLACEIKDLRELFILTHTWICHIFTKIIRMKTFISNKMWHFYIDKNPPKRYIWIRRLACFFTRHYTRLFHPFSKHFKRSYRTKEDNSIGNFQIYRFIIRNYGISIRKIIICYFNISCCIEIINYED